MKNVSIDKASACSAYWLQVTFPKQYTIKMEFSAWKLNRNWAGKKHSNTGSPLSSNQLLYMKSETQQDVYKSSMK